MTDKIVGVKELRENIDKYAAQVRAGRSITVVKRSEPLFRLVPVDDDDANWETMIDFRKLPGYVEGIDAEELLGRLRKLNGQSRQSSKTTK